MEKALGSRTASLCPRPRGRHVGSTHSPAGSREMPGQGMGSAPPLPSDRAPLLGRPGLSQEPPSPSLPRLGFTGDPLPESAPGSSLPTQTQARQAFSFQGGCVEHLRSPGSSVPFWGAPTSAVLPCLLPTLSFPKTRLLWGLSCLWDWDLALCGEDTGARRRQPGSPAGAPAGAPLLSHQRCRSSLIPTY